MEDNALSSLLTMILVIMCVVLFVLFVVYIFLLMKSRKKNKPTKDAVLNKNMNDKKPEKLQKSTVDNSYSKQSILDFMEFDKVEDNMIIQKNGKRFLMVIECQGVNYDLMSKIEKVSVEEGFQQFLNTLRHPIQIYIQTRTVNLDNSINTYKNRVNHIEDNLEKMKFKYKQMVDSGVYPKEDLDGYLYEITKQRNLLEYGKDIVANTEKMSKNKNILNKRYYVIVPYYTEELGDNQFDGEEVRNIAFSELYTKCQAIIRTLSVGSVNGRILSSNELIDLLYVAYNRDESEIYGINTALKAGYDDLYTTSMDVFEKKIKILDQEIRNRAIDLANDKINIAKSRKRELAEKKEKEMDELIKAMAEVILEENKKNIGEDIAEDAIEQIKTEDEGGIQNENVKKTTRGRKKKIS